MMADCARPTLTSLVLSFLLFVSDFTVIYDAFPKARMHLLVLPRRKLIAKVADLSTSRQQWL